MRSDRSRLRALSSRPLILLVVGIGVMAGVALEAYRAVRSQRATVEEVLREYTAFATWSLEQHVRDELDVTFWQILQPVNHGDALHTSPEIPSAADLAHLLPYDSAGCYCHHARHAPRAFFAFALGADTVAVAPNLYAGPDRGVRVVRVPPELPEFRHLEARPGEIRRMTEARRRALHRRLTEHARTLYQTPDRLAVLTHETVDGRSLVGYTLMPTVWGDTILYAAELGPPTVQELFAGVLGDEELLPAAFTRGRANRDVLVARVTDDAGARIFHSDDDAPLADGETERLPHRFGSLTVRAAIRPEVAGSLVIGGLPRSRLPYLLGLFALACGLAVAGAVQVRRAGELTRLRSQFVASVSHELRTPLTQIRMYLQTLRLGRYTTDAQRGWLLENADRESARLANLVENVLEFTSARSHSDAPAADPVDLAGEIRRATAAYEPLAAYRRTAIAVDAAAEAWARIPPSELRQVVFNLLDNAVKYGPAGQTVTIRCRADADVVRIEVVDEGPGVAAAERDRIWRPFHRGDGDATRTAGGSGIGLSIVREIVERHGGRAWVEDSSGGGARFVVALPRVPDRETRGSAPGSDPPATPTAGDASAPRADPASTRSGSVVDGAA